MAQILQAQWAEVGITANLIPADNFVENFLVANAPGLGFIRLVNAAIEPGAVWFPDDRNAFVKT